MVEHPAGTGWRGVYLQALRPFRFPARPSAPVVSFCLWATFTAFRFSPLRLPASLSLSPSLFTQLFQHFSFSLFRLPPPSLSSLVTLHLSLTTAPPACLVHVWLEKYFSRGDYLKSVV
jgi:hypothetical protein